MKRWQSTRKSVAIENTVRILNKKFIARAKSSFERLKNYSPAILEIIAEKKQPSKKLQNPVKITAAAKNIEKKLIPPPDNNNIEACKLSGFPTFHNKNVPLFKKVPKFSAFATMGKPAELITSFSEKDLRQKPQSTFDKLYKEYEKHRANQEKKEAVVLREQKSGSLSPKLAFAVKYPNNAANNVNSNNNKQKLPMKTCKLSNDLRNVKAIGIENVKKKVKIGECEQKTRKPSVNGKISYPRPSTAHETGAISVRSNSNAEKLKY